MSEKHIRSTNLKKKKKKIRSTESQESLAFATSGVEEDTVSQKKNELGNGNDGVNIRRLTN